MVSLHGRPNSIWSNLYSGKSTQVPAFILEHQLSQGKPCKIYCTEVSILSVHKPTLTDVKHSHVEYLLYLWLDVSRRNLENAKVILEHRGPLLAMPFGWNPTPPKRRDSSMQQPSVYLFAGDS